MLNYTSLGETTAEIQKAIIDSSQIFLDSISPHRNLLPQEKEKNAKALAIIKNRISQQHCWQCIKLIKQDWQSEMIISWPLFPEMKELFPE